jgi:hypothetical protein
MFNPFGWIREWARQGSKAAYKSGCQLGVAEGAREAAQELLVGIDVAGLPDLKSPTPAIAGRPARPRKAK